MNTENSENNQGKEAKKVKDLFDRNIKTMVAIVGGTKNMDLKNKIPANDVGNLVDELFKEDREAAVKEAKDELRTILKKRVALENELAAKRKEFEAIEIAKKKEFNQQFAKVIGKFESLGQLESQYYSVLTNDEPKEVIQSEVDTEDETESSN